MKRISHVCFAGMFVIGMLSGQALCQSSAAQNQNTAASGQSSAAPSATQEQPLGNYARAFRKNKTQANVKTFDNDTIPKSDTISVVGNSSASATQAAASQDETQAQPGSNDQNRLPKVTPGQSQEQRQQVYEQWQEKLTSQQGRIEGIAQELDLDQREYRLRAASFYGDAGARLRDQGQWDKEEAQYKQKIADKQKELNDAKQGLSDLQEEARKAGIPSSVQQTAAPDSNEQ